MQEFGTSVSNDVDNLNAFVLNPMNQAEASKVAIYSGADYAWNTAEFESHSSWQRAIKELTPDTAKSYIISIHYFHNFCCISFKTWPPSIVIATSYCYQWFNIILCRNPFIFYSFQYFSVLTSTI